MPAVQNEQRSFEIHQHDSIFDSREFSMHQTDTSARPGSSSASGNPQFADAFPRNWSFEDNIEVVKPYAIEEPDDEAPQVMPRLVLSEPPREVESWQGELVESMEDLHCDSDHNGSTYHSQSHNGRGKKRKSPTFTLRRSGSVSRENMGAVPDMQYEESGLSPKRLHRRSQRSKEDLRASWNAFSQRDLGREAGSSSNFTRSPISRDASEMSPTDNADETDKMDID